MMCGDGTKGGRARKAGMMRVKSRALGWGDGGCLTKSKDSLELITQNGMTGLAAWLMDQRNGS